MAVRNPVSHLSLWFRIWWLFYLWPPITSINDLGRHYEGFCLHVDFQCCTAASAGPSENIRSEDSPLNVFYMKQTPFQLSTNIIPFQCWYISDYILKAILTNFSALSASSCETYDYPRLTAKTEGRSMESVNDGFSSYLVGMHNYIFTAQYAHCCPEPLTL